MTAHKDLKTVIRERQARTGESYTAARAHVMRVRAELLGLPDGSTAPGPSPRVEAIVLKVNLQSVRVLVPSESLQVTFRASGAWEVVPGHVVTLVMERRWPWQDDAYASGAIEDARVDVPKLGLTPLPLREVAPSSDLRTDHEPFRSPDPYAPLWRKFTATPRACWEMDPIAWGVDNPTRDAAELAEVGDDERARALLMDVLLKDLRCLDAHALLGNLEFDRMPERAQLHYEIGMRIGELSLPPGFDGVLLWGSIYNRPFLRCLRGYGLCLWRLGHAEEARAVFERNLSLNPNDNQGARFCWEYVREGRAWEEMEESDRAERAEVAERLETLRRRS